MTHFTSFSFIIALSVLFFVGTLVLMPGLVFAQGAIEEGLSFVHSTSLWTAIVIGILTSGAVLSNARRIGGGVLAAVYRYFGIGMIVIVLGFIAVVIPPWASAFTIMRTHDLLFILGFGIMAYGAKKMLEAAGMK